jgi:hypothetical protein
MSFKNWLIKIEKDQDESETTNDTGKRRKDEIEK